MSTTRYRRMVGTIEPPRFPVETIPNEDYVFVRYHKARLNQGPLRPPIIQMIGDDGISCDWNKYRTASACVTANGRSQDNFGIVVLNVGMVRKTKEADVKHDPVQPDEKDGPNQAHSLVVDRQSEPGSMPTARKVELRQVLFEI